ncbi:MAG: glutathione S-transferase family protein [Proteobacteria bacterium]|nr:glutathione S-transferase family protein [Pseudomonadota bacterium]
MILIGMFDSPFVRRVAVSAELLGFNFEHRSWSVGKDFDRIREYNPLGRVPTLVLDSGEALVESGMILDWLDEQAGPERALLPGSGKARRDAQRFIAMTVGTVEKGIHLIIERVFKPEDKRHAPWVERCRVQIHGGLTELDRLCAAAGDSPWLLSEKISQADVTLACYCTYLRDAVPLELSAYPALHERVRRCEALAAFGKFYLPFDAPAPKETQDA